MCSAALCFPPLPCLFASLSQQHPTLFPPLVLQVNGLFEQRTLEMWQGVAEDSGSAAALQQRLQSRRT